MANTTSISVLLIENDPAIAAIIREALTDDDSDGPCSFRLIWKQQLADGLKCLNELDVQAVLLGLAHANGQGIEMLDQIAMAAPDIPIVLLTDSSDETLVSQALRRGAQEYYSRNHIHAGCAYWLPKALRQAIERKLLATTLRATEEALYAEQAHSRATLNCISDAVLTTDVHGNVTHLNFVAEKLTGWPRHEAVGRPLSEVFNIIDGNTRQTIESPAARVLREHKAADLAVNSVLIGRDGCESGIEDAAVPIHDISGALNGAVLVFRDVGIARGMALKMAYLAQHDTLTDLPNRALMHDRLAQALVLAHRHQRKVALLYMDLDHFKNINDSLGHPIGDKLLQVVADRLQACVRFSDTVSRQGGDEFVVLLTEIEQPQDAALCAEKMLDALTVPIAIDSHQLYITLSIGISIYPDDGETAETLIRNADTAMYHAKDSGRANFQFFTPDMNKRVVERQSLEVSLRGALERGEFVLHYQPKINLESDEITGVEALVRWQHPERGLIPPSQFVPIAEECGIIVKIGNWVLREACRQAQAWLLAGLEIKQIAVNISSLEFRAKNFPNTLRTILNETGLSPGRLELELTESVLMHDTENVLALLDDLKRMGVKIAVDDFGTGYSSLNDLKRFPIDTLKIDQSFVQCMTTDPADAAIVNAVIGMGKSLNYRVVAEGVETQEQHLFLQANLCDESQGHHFSRPLTAEGITNLLGSHVPALQ